MQAVEYIQQLDLGYLAERLIHKGHWDIEEAFNAVERYKKFLILIYLHPTMNPSPAYDMDEVWHAHILHTKEYMLDCKKIFKRYLHHQPILGNQSAEEKLRMQETNQAFAQLYMEK